jgi:tetratricopeptide (TPR) repeat protein
MYLYYFHFFDEPMKIDLATELQKGKHGVRIADFFPIEPFSSVTYEELVPRPGRTVLKQIIDSSGMDSALSAYNRFNTDYISKRSKVDISEDEINELGYNLKRQNRLQDAIKVFQLNVREHPDSWNLYDGLGEAFMNVGNKENAIKNYEQSVKLNPNNQSGINALRKLKQ